MKKIITLLTAFLLLSCSKDSSSGDGSLPINLQNMLGQWKFKSLVRANGTVVPYVGRCAAKTDYIEFFAYGKVVTYNYKPPCDWSENYGGNPCAIGSEDHIIYTNGFFFNYPKVISLTAQNFTMEYDTPQNLDYLMYSATDIKQVTFERK